MAYSKELEKKIARRKKRKETETRKRGQRKLLGEALSQTIAEAEVNGPVDPVVAIQHVLDRTYSWLVYSADRAGKLPEDKLWRKTNGGNRIPNEWIRLERDLRSEVSYLAGRMLDLDIEDRKAQAAEIVATALAPVLAGVIRDLKLTQKQEARAKKVVAKHLRVLEGGSDPLTPRTAGED